MKVFAGTLRTSGSQRAAPTGVRFLQAPAHDGPPDFACGPAFSSAMYLAENAACAENAPSRARSGLLLTAYERSPQSCHRRARQLVIRFQESVQCLNEDMGVAYCIQLVSCLAQGAIFLPERFPGKRLANQPQCRARLLNFSSRGVDGSSRNRFSLKFPSGRRDLRANDCRRAQMPEP